MLKLIFLVAAIVVFILAAFSAVQSKLAEFNLLALGLALLALSILLGLSVVGGG